MIHIPRRDLEGIAKRLKDALAKVNVYLDARPTDKFMDEGAVFAYTNSRGRTYYLHGRTTFLKTGKKQTIYFFSKGVSEHALGAVPVGYAVYETAHGLPVLKVA